MNMLKKLDTNDVYQIDERTAIMTHLSNNPTGARDGSGRMLDNIQDEGWYLFKGEMGRMKPVKKLSEREALKIINKG